MLRQILNYMGVHALSKILPISGILLFSFLLTPEDIGIISLHLATIWFLTVLVSGNIYSGIGRFLFDPEIDNAELLGTALIAMLFTTLGVGGLWFLSLAPLEQLTHLPRQVLILQIPIALGLIAESTLTQVSIYQQRSQRLLWLMTLKASLLIVLSVIWITKRDVDKFLGVVYADAVASLFVFLVAAWVISPHIRMRFSYSALSALSSYSLPLIFYAISLSALSQIDRLFIANLLNVSQVGIYSLSYMIGAATLMAAIPIMNAFQPRFFEAMNTQNTSRMTEDAKFLLTLLSMPTILIAFILPSIAHHFLPVEYADGFGFIPLIAIGAMLQIHFLIWTRILAFHNKTSVISVIVFVAMLINCSLNLYLIPAYGIVGAAVATVLAQAAMMTMLQFALYRMALPRQGRERNLLVLTISVLAWTSISFAFSLTFSVLVQTTAAAIFCGFAAIRLISITKNRRVGT